ncbi:hypothetical protein PAECIP111893_02413 [Paenibacillus plantiphilus]|uniref:Uncharacterized protein n=1 Tax=Paenibacillus plantiphilus TaxID=2905650 RepID=A0ABN8GCK4_9BACL|nr:hypothetical protein [Paenibacillus plantiphilus]CAH1205768.1 hypothetical protein PAECIP111893_02413 [Paenibacillus plantiphilus]
MYYDDEFYGEPSEFDQQIDEFKQSLLNAVKEEYKAEMERLQKENEELQDTKSRLEEIEYEHRRKLNELDSAKRDALNIVRREKLTKLMESLYVKVYAAESYREELPKCDKCNERRMIEFLSPSGKLLTEECSCKIGRKKFRPKEHVCVEFSSNDGKLSAWYKPSDYRDSDHTVSSDYMDKLHDDVPFSDIKYHWNSFFLDEAKCQSYCDWLTQREDG